MIVFGEDYKRHPHCLEHLVNQLVPYNRILWVETVGMRNPTISLYDFKRALEILKKWLPFNANQKQTCCMRI